MINQIETGYKPEFSLGAWYAAENANAARQANEEELLKQRLANQQSQVMNPLEARLKELSIAPAEYQEKFAQAQVTDPNYIKSVLQGTKDTNAKIGFEMQKARDTLTSDVGAINAKNRVAITNDNLFNSFREAQKSGDDVKAKSILGMLVQDPKFQQNLQEQAAKDAAAMSRQAAGDEAAMARLKEQERIRSAEEDRRLKEKGPEKLNLEQAAVQDIQRRILIGEITPQQGTLEYAALIAGKQKVNPNAGMVLGTNAEGNVSLQPGETIQTWKPQTKQPSQTPHAMQQPDPIDLKLQDPAYRAQVEAWVKANPNDPKAARWKQKLQGKK